MGTKVNYSSINHLHYANFVRTSDEPFEPDAFDNFPDLRNSLDRDYPSVMELTRVFKRYNVDSLHELAHERGETLKLHNRYDADEVLLIEADIERVQEVTMTRVKASSNRASQYKWGNHLNAMAIQLAHHAPNEGPHFTNLRGFHGSALCLVHPMNPIGCRLCCVCREPEQTCRHVQIGSAGTLWADDNTAAGTLRCLLHMYGNKKCIRSSIIHRFIIKGKTWQLFKQVPTLLAPAHNGKEAHFFYTSHEHVLLNQGDIVHQAFDRHGILHNPERIGTPEEARSKAHTHNEYEPTSTTVYAQRFPILSDARRSVTNTTEDEVEEQPTKRTKRVGTNIVPLN